jgi:tartrate/fumarate subfamily iron-sulfur-dependent hydro-lyase beta chain
MSVARDLAHAKIRERLDRGEPMPDYFKNHPVYYAGPAKTPAGYASGSFGPTTAGRMDSFVDQFQAAGGSMVMVAKGNRAVAVREACKKHGGFYLGSIGGAAANLAEHCIKKVEVVEYPELGMEAIWRIEVVDFPAFIIIDDKGELKLYYRKMHPWTPVEPWEPGDLGIPVIEGPKGAKLALIICHDGMFPEMARECAYKGAEIMIRTAGYTAPIRQAWRFTNQSNAFCNLMITANVCMCGSDGSFDSMGEGMIVNFDGDVLAHGTTGRVDEIITAEVRPDLVREARIHWGVENNIYQFAHRGFTAVEAGAQDCFGDFMQRCLQEWREHNPLPLP